MSSAESPHFDYQVEEPGAPAGPRPSERLHAALDRRARVAARGILAPVAIVGVLEEGAIRIGGEGLPRSLEESRLLDVDDELCAAVLARDGVVEWHDDPLLDAEPWQGFRSCIGSRVSDRNGETVGLVLVLDTTPRAFRAVHRKHVDDVAALARAELESRAAFTRGRRQARALDEERRLLEATCRKLAEADRQKGELLAMLSHELRNPLAPIVASVAILRRLGPRGWEKLDVIERQTRHLKTLVDHLIDACSVVQGQVQLQLEDCRLSDVIGIAVEQVRATIEARGHFLELRLDERLRVRADPERLARALAHVLENAAKYMDDRGAIDVATRAQHGEAEIRISDRGHGMPEELVRSLFEPFVQGARSLDRQAGGLGLGLTFVRHVVVLHGGRVDATSRGPGQGSAFVIRIPLVTEERDPGRSGRRIVIVDDNLDAADTLGEFLRLSGHEVAVAHDGREGVALVERVSPDVVILDIGLPVMDGYQVAQAIRETGSTVRLIACTGYGGVADRERAHAAGFDYHLVKPVDVDHLLEIIAAATLGLKTPA